MAVGTKEEDMKRRKRFTIRLVALGFVVVAVSAAPAQAKLDEGLGFHWRSEQQQGMISPDDRVDRVVPGPTKLNVVGVESSSRQILAADDLTGRVAPTPSQPSVVATDDGGYEWGTIGMSGFVLLLGAIGAYLIVHQSNKGKLAST
jgi:hypothetical protein